MLSNIEKILEKLMYKRLYTFLNSNNIIYNLQFGFRQQYFTSLALINITEIIRKALDDGNIGCRESLILISVQCVTECPYTPISIRPCDFPCPPSIDASRQAIQVLRVVRWDLHCSHPEDLRSNPVRRSSQTHLCFDKTRAIRMLGLFGRERLHEPACVSWLQTTMKLNYVGTAMTNRRAPFRRQTEKVCGCPETLVVPRSELLRPLSGSYA